MFMCFVNMQRHQVQVSGLGGNRFNLPCDIIAELNSTLRPERQNKYMFPVCVFMPVEHMMRILKPIAVNKGYLYIELVFECGTDGFEHVESLSLVFARGVFVSIMLVGVLFQLFSKKLWFEFPWKITIVLKYEKGIVCNMRGLKPVVHVNSTIHLGRCAIEFIEKRPGCCHCYWDLRVVLL